MAVLYKDAVVTIDESGIIIPRYYMPRGNPKRIPWSEIRSVRMRPTSIFTGKLRVWGADWHYWFNLDWKRPLKRYFIAIDTGSWVKPAITPDDPEVALAIIDEKLQTTKSNEPLRGLTQ